MPLNLTLKSITKSVSTMLNSVFGDDDFRHIRNAVVFHKGFVAHQYLPPNLVGRDFLVADLHGCYAKLMSYLLAVDFDRSKDRLILVGDLIDRGPASFECLMLLLQPWVHAVLGNHEWLLLTWLAVRDSDYHRAESFLPNGGDWALHLNEEQWDLLTGPLVKKLLSLPLVLTVQDTHLPYHVAHGELLGKGRLSAVLTDAELSEDNVRSLASYIAWSRRMVRQANVARRAMTERGLTQVVDGVFLTSAPVEPGLSLTYVGHNIMTHPTLHRSHVYMDRGAYQQTPESELFALEHGRFAAGLKELGLFQ